MDAEKVMRTDIDLSLPERRRMAWWRWEKCLAEISDLVNRLPQTSKKLGVAMARQSELLGALIYLGDPDPRLDLYRMNGIDLPVPAKYSKALRDRLGEQYPDEEQLSFGPEWERDSLAELGYRKRFAPPEK